ncbi:MAG: type II secretion system F family protein [Acidimicrobiales bacterium]
MSVVLLAALVGAWLLVARAGQAGPVRRRLLEPRHWSVLSIRPPRRRRESKIAERAFPEAIERVARALGSGSPLPDAIVSAARSAPAVLAAELGTVAASAARSVPDALDTWARHPDLSRQLTVAALSLGGSTGGNRATALEGVARTIRERHALGDEVRVQSAQARLSAMVVGAAPVGFAILACVTDHRTARFLFMTAAGWLCTLAAITLNGVGAWWMAVLVRRATWSP